MGTSTMARCLSYRSSNHHLKTPAMKKTFYFTVLLSLMVATVFSQTDSSVVYIKRGALPPDILKKFEQSTVNVTKVENVMKTISEFKGRIDPREIGTAVDTVSTILSRQSNAFAESGVGKYTIGLILWRVFGSSFSDLILKLIFAITAFCIFCIMWKRNFVNKSYTKSVKITSPNSWFPWYKKKQVIERFKYESPHDLLCANEKNDWTEDGYMGPETAAKLGMLLFLLFSLFVLLWA